MTTYSIGLGATLVGHLTVSDAVDSVFRFADEYIRLAKRPVLGQFFEDDLRMPYVGRKGVCPLFSANLVPESEIRELLERSFGVETGNDIALLAAVGDDLPGAVTIARER